MTCQALPKASQSQVHCQLAQLHLTRSRFRFMASPPSARAPRLPSTSPMPPTRTRCSTRRKLESPVCLCRCLSHTGCVCVQAHSRSQHPQTRLALRSSTPSRFLASKFGVNTLATVRSCSAADPTASVGYSTTMINSNPVVTLNFTICIPNTGESLCVLALSSQSFIAASTPFFIYPPSGTYGWEWLASSMAVSGCACFVLSSACVLRSGYPRARGRPFDSGDSLNWLAV